MVKIDERRSMMTNAAPGLAATRGTETAVQPSEFDLLARLTVLDEAVIHIRNRLYRSDAWLLSNDALLLWQDPGSFVVSDSLHCRAGKQALTFAVDSLAPLEPRLKGFQAYVPANAYIALVEHALRPVVEALECVLGVQLSPEGHDNGAVAAEPGAIDAGFVLVSRRFELLLRGRVWAASKVWDAMELARAAKLRINPYLRMQVRLTLGIGRSQLRLQRLRNLKVGDGLRLWPRQGPDPDQLSIELAAPGDAIAFRCRLAGETLSVEGRMSQFDSSNTNGGSAAAATDQPLLSPGEVLDDIECEVTFDLGNLRMTVADLARLRPGQSLRLGVRLQDRPVRISVAGRAIARGELALVGDELYVVVVDTTQIGHV
jgi:type III secretion system YscQ/HrcQ family protein